MISPSNLLRLEAHARAHNGGAGDQRLLEAVSDARSGDAPARAGIEMHTDMMRRTGERVCVLVTDEAIATIPRDEIEALATAAWDKGRGDDRLVRLLRRIDPANETLRTLDARARESGYVQAGSDERLDERLEEVDRG